MRAGIGYDIHRLQEGRPLFLGGVEIPYVKGLVGYSDGDVILHAVADAVLGALGRGDIGEHFPDTDPAYEGVASGELLARVVAMAEEARARVQNVDVMLIAEEPKIAPFREKMRKVLASLLKTGEENVNIKATTNEGVGALGRSEAIAAYAVALLNDG